MPERHCFEERARSWRSCFRMRSGHTGHADVQEARARAERDSLVRLPARRQYGVLLQPASYGFDKKLLGHRCIKAVNKARMLTLVSAHLLRSGLVSSDCLSRFVHDHGHGGGASACELCRAYAAGGEDAGGKSGGASCSRHVALRRQEAGGRKHGGASAACDTRRSTLTSVLPRCARRFSTKNETSRQDRACCPPSHTPAAQPAPALSLPLSLSVSLAAPASWLPPSASWTCLCSTWAPPRSSPASPSSTAAPAHWTRACCEPTAKNPQRRCGQCSAASWWSGTHWRACCTPLSTSRRVHRAAEKQTQRVRPGLRALRLTLVSQAGWAQGSEGAVLVSEPLHTTKARSPPVLSQGVPD